MAEKKDSWMRFVYVPGDVILRKDTRTPEEQEKDRQEAEESMNRLFSYRSPAKIIYRR